MDTTQLHTMNAFQGYLTTEKNELRRRINMIRSEHMDKAEYLPVLYETLILIDVFDTRNRCAARLKSVT